MTFFKRGNTIHCISRPMDGEWKMATGKADSGVRNDRADGIVIRDEKV